MIILIWKKLLLRFTWITSNMHLNVLYLMTLNSSSSDISFILKLKKKSKKWKKMTFSTLWPPSYERKDESSLGWITKVVVENCSKNSVGHWNSYESSLTQRYFILIVMKKAKMTWRKLCDPLLREKRRIKLSLNNKSCRELFKE